MGEFYNQLLSLVSPAILAVASFAANKILREPIQDLAKRVSKLEEDRADKSERLAIAEATQRFEQWEVERISEQLNTLLEKIESLLVSKKR